MFAGVGSGKFTQTMSATVQCLPSTNGAEIKSETRVIRIDGGSLETRVSKEWNWYAHVSTVNSISEMFVACIFTLAGQQDSMTMPQTMWLQFRSHCAVPAV